MSRKDFCAASAENHSRNSKSRVARWTCSWPKDASTGSMFPASRSMQRPRWSKPKKLVAMWFLEMSNVKSAIKRSVKQRSEKTSVERNSMHWKNTRWKWWLSWIQIWSLATVVHWLYSRIQKLTTTPKTKKAKNSQRQRQSIWPNFESAVRLADRIFVQAASSNPIILEELAKRQRISRPPSSVVSAGNSSQSHRWVTSRPSKMCVESQNALKWWNKVVQKLCRVGIPAKDSGENKSALAVLMRLALKITTSLFRQINNLRVCTQRSIAVSVNSQDLEMSLRSCWAVDMFSTWIACYASSPRDGHHQEWRLTSWIVPIARSWWPSQILILRSNHTIPGS